MHSNKYSADDFLNVHIKTNHAKLHTIPDSKWIYFRNCFKVKALIWMGKSEASDLALYAKLTTY